MFFKLFFALILFPLTLFSLELTLSIGSEDKQEYGIIEIFNDEPFACTLQNDPLGIPKELICFFSKKPNETLKPVESEFFRIETKLRKGNYFLIVKTNYKLYAKPIIFDLLKKDPIFDAKTSSAKHWIVIGYVDKLPVIEPSKRKPTAISFPFLIEDGELPYVGGLDLKGNPVHIKNSRDVKAFVNVKELFKKGKYVNCAETVDEILKLYPNTLFKAELLYYKIKSLFGLKQYENVITLANKYLKEHSGSENVPEILMMTAVSYYKNGQYADADYFFDRLFSEHADSVYTMWGYVYKGDMAVDSGEYTKAEKFYKKALSKTRSIDVAATAAFELSKLYILLKRYDKAKYYLEKILKAKDDFFFKHYEEAKNMMLDLSDAKLYGEAADIVKAILKYMPKKHDDYESNLHYLGDWLAKAGRKKEALAALERYIKEFKDGNYIDEVEKTRDSIFFGTQQKDYKALLKKYDELIKRYKGDPIAKKALYEKAKLMLDKRMFSDILQIKDQLQSLDIQTYPLKDEIVHKAALGLMESALKNKECQVVLDIQNEYNISVSSKWDFGLYECFIKAANYQKAKKIARRNLKTDDIKTKKKWLYYYAKVDFETGNYSETIDAINDLLLLIEDTKKSPYKDIYRTLFDAYARVGDFEGMIKTIEKIEEIFGVSYEDMDRYVDMINIGITKKDNNIVIEYGKKLYDLQRRIKSHAKSPFVEFALYDAYMDKGDYNAAYEVIASLDSVKMSNEKRARALYLKGAVLEKLWRNDEARKAYEDCIKTEPDSAWAKLAKSAIESM